MYTYLYGLCLIISIFIIVYMATKSYENIDIHYWSVIILVPVIVLGYYLKTRVTTREGAMVAFSFIYIDSTVMLVVAIFTMLRFMQITVKPFVKFIGYTAAFVHMAIIWLCFDNGLYYKDLYVIIGSNGNATKMNSGPLKIIHYLFLAAALGIIIGLLVYGYIKKSTISHRVLNTYSVLITICLIIYVIEMVVDVDFSVLPVLYAVADAIIAIDYDRVHTHDISCLVSEQQKYHSLKGYVAVDLKKRFLSANKAAFMFLPELIDQRVDEAFEEWAERLNTVFCNLIDDFEAKGTTSTLFVEENMTCKCEITRFSIRRDGKPQGYLFDITDVTEEQRIIKVMETYNDTLNSEVQKKTDNIRDIQTKVVIGLANMVENRDNNTGGHVKRTSDVVKILMEEVRKQKIYEISDEKATDIVRAAPMHDLGKISIDNAILCKPGRLTDEEFVIMKTHSSKSGEIVRIILEGVEEQHFVDTAYNVARFHHERWDGRGYPEGRIGEMTPVEARIMAVADVYDALVSKRCYKEAMSFEKADEIMREGMGTQFDPNMLSVFIACRPMLEEYYRINNE